MWWQIFTAQSTIKKGAKFVAIVWTLLIFIACFIPGQEIPKLHIPFADKWVHFVLFGGFTFLWLLVAPSIRLKRLLFISLLGIVFGWLVEELQGLVPFLGRAKDLYDIYADALGAILGVILFCCAALIAQSKIK